MKGDATDPKEFPDMGLTPFPGFVRIRTARMRGYLYLGTVAASQGREPSPLRHLRDLLQKDQYIVY
jgi:hypothetical protein